MDKNDRSFQNYLSRLKWVIATVLSVVSLLGLTKPVGTFLFPPIGSLGNTLAVLSTLASMIALAFPYTLEKQKSCKRLVRAASISFCLALIGYACLVTLARVSIVIPGIQRSVAVIKGFNRREWAAKKYDSMSDSEMAREAGFDDDELDDLWWDRKIVVIVLFLEYCAVYSSFGLFFGGSVRKDQLSRGG